MKDEQESVMYRQEEERETDLSTYERPNKPHEPLPANMNFYDCPNHGRVRGTSCPYGD
jgi:hypothetical protein